MHGQVDAVIGHGSTFRLTRIWTREAWSLRCNTRGGLSTFSTEAVPRQKNVLDVQAAPDDAKRNSAFSDVCRAREPTTRLLPEVM